jgi:hypothetical protein
MKNAILALSAVAAVSFASLPARADFIGALAGGGTGLLVAGPPGAVAGAFIGGFWGRPFWGPPSSPRACWTDDSFHRHCHLPDYSAERPPTSW